MTQQTSELSGRAPTLQQEYGRNLPLHTPFVWLSAGFRDFLNSPGSSLCYGIAVFAISLVVIAALFKFGFSYVLLPSIAGFMIIGPMMAIGLYEKSRRLADNAQKIRLSDMIFVKAQSPWQLLFVGAFLLLVLLFWMRTAILLFAIFFGSYPFSGIEEMIETIVFTSKGLSLLALGTVIGAGLAGLSFSISAFSVPMLMNEKKDTITAMVLSLIIILNNKAVAALWGIIVLCGFLLCLGTGLLGLIVIFPVLGHATWHGYKDIRGEKADEDVQEAPVQV